MVLAYFSDCGGLCKSRCSAHSRPNVCTRACGTCCVRCKCVPPGTSGNRELCGTCYTGMTTHGNKTKCPQTTKTHCPFLLHSLCTGLLCGCISVYYANQCVCTTLALLLDYQKCFILFRGCVLVCVCMITVMAHLNFLPLLWLIKESHHRFYLPSVAIHVIPRDLI